MINTEDAPKMIIASNTTTQAQHPANDPSFLITHSFLPPLPQVFATVSHIQGDLEMMEDDENVPTTVSPRLGSGQSGVESTRISEIFMRELLDQLDTQLNPSIVLGAA
jgi:hypothetical protein